MYICMCGYKRNTHTLRFASDRLSGALACTRRTSAQAAAEYSRQKTSCSCCWTDGEIKNLCIEVLVLQYQIHSRLQYSEYLVQYIIYCTVSLRGECMHSMHTSTRCQVPGTSTVLDTGGLGVHNNHPQPSNHTYQYKYSSRTWRLPVVNQTFPHSPLRGSFFVGAIVSISTGKHAWTSVWLIRSHKTCSICATTLLVKLWNNKLIERTTCDFPDEELAQTCYIRQVQACASIGVMALNWQVCPPSYLRTQLDRVKFLFQLNRPALKSKNQTPFSAHPISPPTRIFSNLNPFLSPGLRSIDIACPDHMIAIECDGPSHYLSCVYDVEKKHERKDSTNQGEVPAVETAWLECH